jgi:Flp pilus assembly pilin Flp
MSKIRNAIGRFWRDEDGATMVEFMFLCCLIGIVMIISMKYTGSTVANKLNRVSGNITNSN